MIQSEKPMVLGFILMVLFLHLSLYFQSLNEAFKERFGYEPGMSLEDIPFRSGKVISQMELEKTKFFFY
jgi:hypothetical protein